MSARLVAWRFLSGRSGFPEGGERVNALRIRLVGLVAIVALVCSSYVGVVAAQDATPAAAPDYSVLNGKKLAFVLWGFDGYQQAQGNWFKNLAEEQGAEVTLIDGKVDPQVQVKAIDDLIAGGIDGIVFQPVEPAAAVNPVRAAQEAGIPLVLAGAEPDPSTGVVAPFVQFNDYEVTFEAGKHAAEWLQANQPDAPARVVIFDVLTLVYCKDLRMQGFLDGVMSVYPEAEVVFRDTVEHKREVSLAKMEDLLQSSPDFNIFTACGADGVLGGISALQAAGRATATDKVPDTEYIFTIDGTPSEIELLLDPNSSVMETMTLTPKENAQAYLDLLTQVMNGTVAPDADVNEKAPGVLLPPNCEELAAILQEQYGVLSTFEPIDCA
jgi:ABC-type sugar transport system substrate-binding protein